jgi:hypothetical protein
MANLSRFWRRFEGRIGAVHTERLLSGATDCLVNNHRHGARCGQFPTSNARLLAASPGCFMSPTNAFAVQRFERLRFGSDGFSCSDGGLQLRDGQVPYRRPLHAGVPRRAQADVEADPHEAVVVDDRPPAGGGHSRQYAARQVEPTSNEDRACCRCIGWEWKQSLFRAFSELTTGLRASDPHCLTTSNMTSLRRRGPGVNGSL